MEPGPNPCGEDRVHPRAGHALFDTALGRCGIAWRGAALSAVMLPSISAAATRNALCRLAPDAQAACELAQAPPFVAQAVCAIQALLRGEPRALHPLPLDWQGVPAFERRVFEAAQRLAPGQTCTYGELATAIGEPLLAARAVGAALGRNPWPIVVPCHRVLAAGGQLGGFSAPGGTRTKRQLLAIEAGLWQRPGDLF